LLLEPGSTPGFGNAAAQHDCPNYGCA
jgi:hypothetical protein